MASTTIATPPQDPRLVGAVVRHIRAHRGLTQQELASAAGVSPRTVRYIEAGDVTSHLATYVQIADALGVPVTDITNPERQAGGAA